MSSQQGTLLDVLKKKMRQTKEEAEKYQEEAEEYRKKLQIEIRRREEVSFGSLPFLISNFFFFFFQFFWTIFFSSNFFYSFQMPISTFGFLELVIFHSLRVCVCVCVYV